MPDQQMEMQPVAPFRGKWERGEEHETMMWFGCREFRIQVRFPWCQSKEIERWLVETLHAWPHPNAPVSSQEHDYPNYRNEAYAKLMEEKR